LGFIPGKRVDSFLNPRIVQVGQVPDTGSVVNQSRYGEARCVPNLSSNQKTLLACAFDQAGGYA
jgi:hypothetical protein